MHYQKQVSTSDQHQTSRDTSYHSMLQVLGFNGENVADTRKWQGIRSIINWPCIIFCAAAASAPTRNGRELAKQLGQTTKKSSLGPTHWNHAQDLQSVDFWEWQTGWEHFMKNQGCNRLHSSQSYPKIPTSFSFLFETLVVLQVASTVSPMSQQYILRHRKTQLTTVNENFLSFCNVN